MRPADHPAAVALLKGLHRGAPRDVAAHLLAQRQHLDDLAPWLVDERLGVYVYGATTARSLAALWPRTARARLEDQWTQQQRRTATLLDALAAIDAAFDQAGIEYRVLKGLPLAARLYGGVGQRFTWDLDVLVRERDVPRALAALRAIDIHAPSWTRHLSWLARRVAHALECRRADGLSIDLHWAFRRLPGLRFPADDVFREQRMQDVNGRAYPILSDEHLLTQVLLGIAADVDRGLCPRRALWEAYLLMQAAPAGGWTGFLDRRDAEGCRSLMANAMALVVYGMDAPIELAPVLQAIAADGRRQPPMGSEDAAAILARQPHEIRNHLAFAAWQSQPWWRYWSWWLLTLPARAFFARRL